MTREQVEEMITLLAAEFRVKRPKVTWHGRYRSGRAFFRQWRIAVGPNCWCGVEHTTVHEFAHILTFKRYGRGVRHEEEFCYCLWHVAAAWYGNAAAYPWHNEYTRVAAFGQRRLNEHS